MDNLGFYKEQYFKEIERAQGISNSFGTPITIMSALAAALYYSWSKFNNISLLSNKILFVFIITLCVFFLFKSLYHLIKAIANFKTGYNYYLLPNAYSLGKYQNDLNLFYLDI